MHIHTHVRTSLYNYTHINMQNMYIEMCKYIPAYIYIYTHIYRHIYIDVYCVYVSILVRVAVILSGLLNLFRTANYHISVYTN